ncbi:hypothetical protein [Salinispira pacifica]|uniref:Uncharacterized protein n=1 Tax=Salinispira pacifica TaxID=1307761 RepID=V5WHI1_9SPIO|nr:hypothetical protein [Salinispira pacifica]AHC15292.1 hypothetical protein L21SP2_1919 [Salinispira pacifica]
MNSALKRSCKLFILLSIPVFLSPLSLAAQEAPSPEDGEAVPRENSIDPAEEGEPEVMPLPGGFTDLMLGTELEELKRRLEANRQFDYRGDPDVSFSPSSEQALIRTDGRGFMESGVFQFHEDRLFSITLNIDTEQMDYFTMFRDLQNKYGEPDYLDPQLSYWEGSGVRMVLEKPLSVKYIDMQVFDQIREDGAARESLGELSRELFLDNF